jgi:hypothetical protein
MVPARQGLLPGRREPVRHRRIFLKYVIKPAFSRGSTLLLRYLKLNAVVGESQSFCAPKTPAVQGPCTTLLPVTTVGTFATSTASRLAAALVGGLFHVPDDEISQ